MAKIINVPLFRKTVLAIHAMKTQGCSHREINRVLGLVDYSPTSSYNIMRMAAARHILKKAGKL